MDTRKHDEMWFKPVILLRRQEIRRIKFKAGLGK
jgi:hypothetical protein